MAVTKGLVLTGLELGESVGVALQIRELIRPPDIHNNGSEHKGGQRLFDMYIYMRINVRKSLCVCVYIPLAGCCHVEDI